ncbi:hypothetical protein KOSB73_150074 [Klebsiella grimontii]|uniref:Uncharacterized protein n=1 Tax=Klebsiella grimontii TaxID=2058152 RepID=A0A285AVY8_9ENTR|nr:hypothetical protein KOSB73_150074 [Klebsiella grimontii]
MGHDAGLADGRWRRNLAYRLAKDELTAVAFITAHNVYNAS